MTAQDIGQMMNDWDAATPQQREEANRVATRLANRTDDGKKRFRRERLEQEQANLLAIAGFMPKAQQAYLAECFRARDYEGDHAQSLAQLRDTIQSMPKTYEQDGLGDDAIVSLHYFSSSSDFWITEKDAGSPDDNPEDFQAQAFGLASINGESPELGYISIRELCTARGVELDFHFKPRTLREVKAQYARTMEPHNTWGTGF